MARIQRCAATTGPLTSTQLFCWSRIFVWSHFLRCLVALLVCLQSVEILAVNSESPEVRELVNQGFAYLEENTDSRLGAKCLIALAFYKDGASPNHHRIQEAINACQNVSAENLPNLGSYNTGLAIIFLAELNMSEHRQQLVRYAEAMSNTQKPHGGWGYSSFETGDTSQTQYAVLSYWELLQSGLTPKVESVESCLNWLLRTQDPQGGWGYQGNDSGSKSRVKQSETTLSMAAAGLGSTMILANVLGLSEIKAEKAVEQDQPKVPSSLRRVESAVRKVGKRLSGNGVDKKRLAESIKLGQDWFKKVSIRIEGSHPCYVLYSIERYKSFEELLSGNIIPEPEWYQQGYEFLKKTQKPYGGWAGRSGKECSTAFALLFLMRSTQKSIKASLGEGTLVGGRGLQADLSRMKMDHGRLVARPKSAEVGDLLGMLNSSTPESLKQLLSNPDSLRAEHAGPEDSRRLQQIVKSGVPEARVLSIRILSQQRNLDHAPTLLYAMTDPDKRVVREARDGLRFLSRRFDGFGLPDDFSDTERYDVIDKWKRWYRRVRPDAPPLQ